MDDPNVHERIEKLDGLFELARDSEAVAKALGKLKEAIKNAR